LRADFGSSFFVIVEGLGLEKESKSKSPKELLLLVVNLVASFWANDWKSANGSLLFLANYWL